jgi:hypothetical protein
MARQPAKSRASTRAWLDEQLKAQNIDSIKEWCSLYKSVTEDKDKINLLQMVWDRIHPKARPVDENDEPGDIRIQLSKEEIEELAKAARGD